MIRSGQWLSTAISACRLTGFFTCLSVITFFQANAAEIAKGDTLFLKKGTPVFLLDRIYIIKRDTAIIKPRPPVGGYERSEAFYDSVYKKFSRKKFTRYIYSLAFRAPKTITIADTQQVVKSESPFRQYKGKVIRNISIISLDPFGPNINDPGAVTKTGVGKFLNSVHKSTYPYVIRNNLIIKEGKKIDPDQFAENERHIRDLSYINDVRTIVHEVGGTDSVDVIIVTQDVWSIGFDFLTITPSRLRMRLYDANFLGTGDRLSLNFSTDLNRGPFFLLDGASYRFSNISGTFIDVLGSFSQTSYGDRTVLIGAQRSFYSNRTKWAGGINIAYRKWVDENFHQNIAYMDFQNIWGGRAWYLEKESKPTRLVALAALNRTNFSSRPPISIDSNRRYYNTFQFFPGFAYSRNNYYISGYLVEFGKTENIPYGNLFQINLGPEKTDYYTRFYGGFELSGGDFIKNFGYLSGSVRGGGFLHQGKGEDEVLKVTTRYITPVFTSVLQRYKSRTFFVTDYRIGINERSNNNETYNINRMFDIDHFSNDSIFASNKSLSLSVSTILFTPWYFYGFKFAVVGQVQGGWWAKKEQNLFSQPFYFGCGAGIMTKNNNLIFPTIIFSLYFYPEYREGIPPLQYRFIPDASLHLPDFNPRIPGTETIQN